MKRSLVAVALTLGLTACGGSSSTGLPTPTRVAQVAATPTLAPRPTVPTKPVATPTATVTAGKPYQAFLASICGALVARNTQVLTNALPYFQYNSGLRYGVLGDGEGSTGDPSLFNTWLTGAHVRCRFYTPDQAGHGTVLTDGWLQNGGWGLIEMDTYNGVWKINDFTFGAQSALYQAMQTSHPIEAFHGA